MDHDDLYYSRTEGQRMTRTLASLALVLTLLLVGANRVDASDASCPIHKAHYHLSSNRRVSLSFVVAGKSDGGMSDLAMKLTPPDGAPYWFLFDAGTARYVNLISTGDVTAKGWHHPRVGGEGGRLGSMHYVAWSGAYDFYADVPKSTTMAPERIFLPDLSEVMAYRAEPRVELPYGVFIRDKCE